MERLRLLVLSLAVASGCTSNPSRLSELREFRFKGKPISAAAVHALLTEWSDFLPAVAAVDLEGFTDSEVHNYPNEQMGTFVAYHPGERKYENPGTFKYRHLGVSKQGVHVLEWLDNGGGSGTMYGALLVRFEQDRVFDSGEWRQRIRMLSVGEVWDPDHTGTFQFDGRRLTGRDPFAPGYRIDLVIE
ncbi:MAG TPA: hypothetical protein VK661_09385 [Planctomycetota bacterium]|nr:hypothetical protein [Planctomycetota bacterium]